MSDVGIRTFPSLKQNKKIETTFFKLSVNKPKTKKAIIKQNEKNLELGRNKFK